MTTMQRSTSCPTIADRPTLADATAQAACTATTWAAMSRNRAEGIVWAERIMCQARSASGDAERFMKGM